MRDVSSKVSSLRTAVARSVVKVSPISIQLIREGNVPKGDPLPVARVAAIQAVKNTPQLIPYCHTVPIDYVRVDFEIGEDSIASVVTVKSIYKTGVEMEAMAGAMVAALNFYDILKMVDDTMSVTSVTLEDKQGGKSSIKSASGWTFAVLVASDRASAGEYEDSTGPVLQARLVEFGGSNKGFAVVPDEPGLIREQILSWISQDIDVIVTTGGTGLGPRDVTSDVVGSLMDKELPGVQAHYAAYGQARNPMAMLGRPRAGLAENSLIIALPGSKGAVQEGLDALFPYVLHALDARRGCGH